MQSRVLNHRQTFLYRISPEFCAPKYFKVGSFLTELGYLSSHGGVFRPVYVDQIESWYGRIPHGPVYHAKLGA